MKNKYAFILFGLLTILIFRNYFFNNLVPFSSNLLISFYEPWITYAGANKVPNKPIGFDSLRIFFSIRELETNQIKNFQIPLWNPYAFSGNMLLATYQSAVFHPLSLLFFVLPQIDAWSLIVVLAPFLSSLFMYFFLKELSLKNKIALFGAVVFAFSGYFVVWWEESFMSVYSALFLPLVLYAILKLFKKPSSAPFALLTTGLTFSILSGWFQTSFYLYLFSFIWTIFLFFTFKKDRKTLILIFLAFLISFLLSGIHLIPNLEAFIYSARGTTDAKFIFDDYLLPLQRLVTFLIPDFYGSPATYNFFAPRTFYYETALFIGIPSLIASLYAILSWKTQTSLTKFFSVSSILTLSLGFSLPTSWFLLYYLKLPFISTVLPTRIFFLSTFCLSVLAAFGLDYLIKKPQFRKIIPILLLLWASIGVSIYFLIFPYKKDVYQVLKHSEFVSLKNMVIPIITLCATSLLMLIFTVFKKFQRLFYILFFLITLVGIFYFANKYLFFSQRYSVFPQAPVLKELQKIAVTDRVWGYKGGHIESNFLTFYHLFSVEGYDSFYVRRYGELLGAGLKRGVYSNQIPRTDASIVTNDYEAGIEKNLYRNKLISLLDVKYVIEKNSDNIPHKNSDIFKPIWTDGLFTIYEYKEAYPRTFLADKFLVENSSSNLIKAFFDPNVNLRETILLEKIPNLISNQTTLVGNAQILKYTPNEVLVKTTSNKQAILFLSDTDYPGWNAYVDGRKTELLRADYAFRAVVLPQGKHTVSFNYEPNSFKIGLLLTIIGLIGFFVIFKKLKK